MATVAYTNTGKNNVHIDGKTIHPGESREVDETQVPGFGVSADHTEDDLKKVDNPLADILLGNIQSVMSALHDLTAEQLADLESLEGDSATPRKGVLDGIDKRRLELAQVAVES
jgi:hypothetical protein